MNVLLTGGHGAVGRFVLEELDRRGHDVTVFDLNDDEALQTRLSYNYIHGDVTDTAAVKQAMDNMDVVVHLAALKRPACENDPKLAQEVIVGGTVNVFEAAVAANTRVIHVSTKSVFGQVSGTYAYPHYDPLPEDAPKRSVGDIYSLTKRAAENYRQAYARKFDLDVASFRFASTFGPGKMAVPGKGMLVPDAIEGAMKGDSVDLPGGDELNDWIYFGDIANGLADSVEAPTLTYPTYHLGTGELRSLKDFASVLRKECPEATVTVEDGYNPQNKDHPMYARLDISRAQEDLSYEPEYSLADGIRDYMNRLDPIK